MARIRCHYSDCVFLDQGYCSAAAVEIDPEEGCLTYSPSGEVVAEEAWEANEALEEEWADAGYTAGGGDEEDDFWLEDDPLLDDDVDELDFDEE